jgi:hypothetical protein
MDFLKALTWAHIFRTASAISFITATLLFMDNQGDPAAVFFMLNAIWFALLLVAER